MHHQKPKSHRRAAKHQYSTIVDGDAIALLRGCIGASRDDARLWPYPLTFFKKCVDQILAALEVPTGTFTMAGLRGGGAIAEFRRAGDIPTLAWRLRVKSQDTLGHYLQETSAAVSLRDLPTASREKLNVAAGFYTVLMHECTET